MKDYIRFASTFLAIMFGVNNERRAKIAAFIIAFIIIAFGVLLFIITDRGFGGFIYFVLVLIIVQVLDIEFDDNDDME